MSELATWYSSLLSISSRTSADRLDPMIWAYHVFITILTEVIMMMTSVITMQQCDYCGRVLALWCQPHHWPQLTTVVTWRPGLGSGGPTLVLIMMTYISISITSSSSKYASHLIANTRQKHFLSVHGQIYLQIIVWSRTIVFLSVCIIVIVFYIIFITFL